jgi:hypothetical protein
MLSNAYITNWKEALHVLQTLAEIAAYVNQDLRTLPALLIKRGRGLFALIASQW